jgi:hypothetical protein
MDVERSGRGLIISYYPGNVPGGTIENYEKPQSG